MLGIDVQREKFEFTGTGAEYFRIWIVNILLTVLTLGIFSAWAKVRRMQYFYRHTRLAGAGFDYHGRPIAILKGRIIAAALLGGYYAAGYAGPLIQLGALGLLLLVLPWLISRSLRFRLHNASYRGLRFRFTGSVGEAYRTFLLFPVAVIATSGLLGPWWHQRMRRYVHANAWYGRTPFRFHADVASFYRVYFAAAGMMAGVMVGAVLVIVPLVLMFGGEAGSPGRTAFFTTLVLIAYLCGAVAVWAFRTARIQNLCWNDTQIGEHRFLMEIETGRLVFITVTNLLAIVLTLGLYKPYADVRLTQYLLSVITVQVAGSVDDFVAGEEAEIGAAGDEAVDMFDLDLAI